MGRGLAYISELEQLMQSTLENYRKSVTKRWNKTRSEKLTSTYTL